MTNTLRKEEGRCVIIRRELTEGTHWLFAYNCEEFAKVLPPRLAGIEHSPAQHVNVGCSRESQLSG